MPGSVTNRQQVLPVPAGTQVPAASISGTGDGGLDGAVAPYTFLADANNPAAKVPLAGIAQDGTDSSDANATQATAGVGIRGWLSTLVSLLRAGTAKVTVSALPTASTAALSSVSASTSSVALLGTNTARKGLQVYNDSLATLYLAYGATASLTTYTTQIPPGGAWEMPRLIFTGALSAIWSSPSGAARITEMS